MHLLNEFGQPTLFIMKFFISPYSHLNRFPLTFDCVCRLLEIETAFFVFKIPIKPLAIPTVNVIPRVTHRISGTEPVSAEVPVAASDPIINTACNILFALRYREAFMSKFVDIAVCLVFV